MGDLAELLPKLRARPRLYLPEWRYTALVAYVEGFDAGGGGQQLEGFQEWVSEEVLGKQSAFHWSTIVASGECRALLDGQTGVSVLSAEESERASYELIRLMLAFLGRSPTS